jgi:hypothetical protein
MVRDCIHELPIGHLCVVLLLQQRVHLCHLLLLLKLPLSRILHVMLSVFWISPMRILNPPRRVLMSSNSWRSEVDCRRWTGGGSSSESDECLVHAAASASRHPDPLASCYCGVWSQPGWYPGTCMAGNHSVWYAWGTSGVSVGGSCWELSASFLVLLRVNLWEIELLRTSSCSTRAKVSSDDLYKKGS